MPGFLRAATTVCCGGAIVGVGALAMLPSAPQGLARLWPVSDSVRISDLPPAPCKQQLWLNTDRACQTWTTAKGDVERVLATKPEAARNVHAADNIHSADNVTVVARAPKASVAVPTSAPRSQPVIIASMPQTAEGDEPPQATPMRRDVSSAASQLPVDTHASMPEEILVSSTSQSVKSKPAGPHNAAIPGQIPVAARSADGTRRVIIIRPTSRQDAMYYSARRELAAVNAH
jgi:hypothetical protein